MALGVGVAVLLCGLSRPRDPGGKGSINKYSKSTLLVVFCNNFKIDSWSCTATWSQSALYVAVPSTASGNSDDHRKQDEHGLALTTGAGVDSPRRSALDGLASTPVAIARSFPTHP